MSARICKTLTTEVVYLEENWVIQARSTRQAFHCVPFRVFYFVLWEGLMHKKLHSERNSKHFCFYSKFCWPNLNGF